MFKPHKTAIMAVTVLAMLPGLAAAQTAIVDNAIPQKVDMTNVVRAQFIKPGDVSPEEYQRLLDEAEKIRSFQGDVQGSYSYNGNLYDFTSADTTIVSEPAYGGFQNGYTLQGQTVEAETTPVYTPGYEIELYDNPITRQYAPLQSAQSTVSLNARGQTQQAVANHVNARTQTFTSNYVVVKGDTLYSIARRYDVALKNLKAENGLSGNAISIGQTLAIPTGQVISYRSVPRNTAVARNPVINNQVIQAADMGQSVIYAVLPGDTVYSIARRACISIDQLTSINALSDVNSIRPGQRLSMPSGHCLK